MYTLGRDKVMEWRRQAYLEQTHTHGHARQRPHDRRAKRRVRTKANDSATPIHPRPNTPASRADKTVILTGHLPSAGSVSLPNHLRRLPAYCRRRRCKPTDIHNREFWLVGVVIYLLVLLILFARARILRHYQAFLTTVNIDLIALLALFLIPFIEWCNRCIIQRLWTDINALLSYRVHTYW